MANRRALGDELAKAMAKNKIAAMGNTVVPALLTLEHLGFTVQAPEGSDLWVASRGDEEFVANDPVTVLGLVKLIEARSWNWNASDGDIEAVLAKYHLK